MSEPPQTPLGDTWPQMPVGWTPDDTEKFLTNQALPGDFLWPHRDKNADGSDNLQPVMPSYRLHKGYGFWLRTTPYYPGLFEEIHAILLRWPDEVPLPEVEVLTELLNQRRTARGTQPEFKL